MDRYIALVLGCMFLVACSSHDDGLTATPDDAENIIHVSGVSTPIMLTNSAVTRADEQAKTKEVPEWLKKGLEVGLKLTYFKGDKKQDANLKFESDAYTLKDDDGHYCKWLDNGLHTFLGIYMPESLKVSKTHSYNDLDYYTAIPPSTEIKATLDGITIPLQHRLARVVAYVLIDKSLGSSVTLKGYNKDNAADTKLRFCNVQVLDYVDANGQPVWKEEPKAIPHYLDEVDEVVVYQENATGKLIFPTDTTAWKKANQSQSGYTATKYNHVPYYDIIVRPTYTEVIGKPLVNVMYDEANDNKTDTLKNQIKFDLTLSNDLEYEKDFVFDLNANDETVVYLRVSPERIDYNSTGARLWHSEAYHDDYYGVNHEGYALSQAGSSWQRAYTNDTVNYKVTDGHAYDDVDAETVKAQYVSTEQFIKLLKQAKVGGSCDHKYFILHNDIEIDLADFPDDIVFTGHLDALDHQITVKPTGERDWLFAGIGEGRSSEVLNIKIAGGKLFKTDAALNGHISNCWNGNTRIQDVIPALKEYK